MTTHGGRFGIMPKNLLDQIKHVKRNRRSLINCIELLEYVGNMMIRVNAVFAFIPKLFFKALPPLTLSQPAAYCLLHKQSFLFCISVYVNIYI